MFDAYAGHSWASGTAPFADGNNQESSSEAVTAWTGLALWAEASEQRDAGHRGDLDAVAARPSRAGLLDQLRPVRPVYAGYGHKIVPLNWGGKRDYATWFSPEPAAMLGILVIPMSPASTYLGGRPRADRGQRGRGDRWQFDQKFGDYLLMYSALAGPEQQRETALAAARTLDEQVDRRREQPVLPAGLADDGADLADTHGGRGR